jgi:hypothetical protein
MRYFAFWTFPSVWRVWMIWFLRVVDSVEEGEDGDEWLEELEEEEVVEEELKGLGMDGKDMVGRGGLKMLCVMKAEVEEAAVRSG